MPNEARYRPEVPSSGDEVKAGPDHSGPIDQAGSIGGAADVPGDVKPEPYRDFDQLYESEYRGLLRVAFVLVDTEEEAEEVVQEAFARVLARWNRIANRGAYLRQAVFNGCRDVQRRRSTRRRHLPERPSSHPEQDYLLDAVRRLKPRQQAVVTLRFYLDLSVDQIAETLELRPGTVKSSLHRALVELRRVMQP